MGSQCNVSQLYCHTYNLEIRECLGAPQWGAQRSEGLFWPAVSIRGRPNKTEQQTEPISNKSMDQDGSCITRQGTRNSTQLAKLRVATTGKLINVCWKLSNWSRMIPRSQKTISGKVSAIKHQSTFANRPIPTQINWVLVGLTKRPFGRQTTRQGIRIVDRPLANSTRCFNKKVNQTVYAIYILRLIISY